MLLSLMILYNWMQMRAVDKDEQQEAMIETEVTETNDRNRKAKEDDVATPNYAVWILSLVSVIGVFYALVFYAGTGGWPHVLKIDWLSLGLVYMVAKKIQFKKKDFVPYSVKLEQERKEMQLRQAPPVDEETEEITKIE